MLNRIIGIAAAALVSFAMLAAPVQAQKSSTYGKVEQPWYPQGKISGGISVSGTSAATALPAAGLVAWVCNTGSTNDAYLAFGGSSIAAVVAGTTGNGTWLKASTCAPYDLFPPFASAPNTYIAAITSSSTTTLTVETGIGTPPQQLVASGGGGGAGAVYGPTAAGLAAANPPVLVGGTVDGTATGAVNNLKVAGGLAYINCANCTGSGASAADEAAMVAGTSLFAPSGGFFQTTATLNPLTNLQQGLVQMTAQRAYFTNVRNSSGAELGLTAAPFIIGGPGTAGSAAGGILTVQGVASMTPFLTTTTLNAETTKVIGTVNQGTSPWIDTANQGTANTLANAWPSKITDGTNGPVAVKPASTAAVATDTSLVTTKSPNSPDVPFAASISSSITRSANTTTYTANTGWNNGTPTFFSFTAACRVNGGQVLIPSIHIWSSANPTLKLTGYLWLFSAVPGTNVADDATFTIASADYANLTGNYGGFAFSLVNDQASGAANSGVSLTGVTYHGKCASGSTTITGMVQVGDAYVPASGEVLTVILDTIGLN
jgi:hypothetical protein